MVTVSKGWFLDGTIVLSVLVLNLITTLGIIPPRPTSFQCDDVTIRHSYRRDTISAKLLLIVTIAVPAFQILITEWILFHSSPCASPLRKGFKVTLRHTYDIVVGMLFSWYTVDLLKMTISEPRPHFWFSCLPNISKQQCDQPWVTITYQNCTNPTNMSFYRLIDTMKSFPSGHACLALFTSVYMIWYIQKRVVVRWSHLLVPLLQLVWVTWAVGCSASRIFDRRHHWWDVLFGACVGLVYGYLTFRYLSLFSVPRSPPSQDSPPEGKHPQMSLSVEGIRDRTHHSAGSTTLSNKTDAFPNGHAG